MVCFSKQRLLTINVTQEHWLNKRKNIPARHPHSNSISSSAMANNKTTNEDTDMLPLDDVDGQPKKDEWDNFGQFIAFVMRSIKDDARRQRLKVELMTVLQRYQQEDYVYSELIMFNNVNNISK